jgi:hypothetical protein
MAQARLGDCVEAEVVTTLSGMPRPVSTGCEKGVTGLAADVAGMMPHHLGEDTIHGVIQAMANLINMLRERKGSK